MDASLNLPDEYEYTLFKVIRKGDCINHTMNCDQLKTKDDMENWVKCYGNKAFIEWRVAQTFPNLKQKRVLLKIKYRCQHSFIGYKKKSTNRQSKSTNCPAQLIISRVLLGGKESTQILLKYTHNHDMGTTAASLRYRDVSNETKEKIKELFQHGHSPSSAYHTLQKDAIIECSDDYSKVAADRKHLPDKMYFYNLYHKEFTKENGSSGDDNTNDFPMLESMLKRWSENTGGKASVQLFNKEVIVCIVTPLMLRVHSAIQQSGELLFVDASEHCDRVKHQIYLLHTQSVAGCLPLGYIITNSGKQDIFAKAFVQYLLLDSENTFFFGKGSLTGPTVCITDNDLSERNSLTEVWPHSTILLCTVHVLRAVWRWLIASKNQIKKTDQLSLFSQFKQVIYGSSPEDAEQFYDNIKNSSLGIEYPQFINYIKTTWWPIKELWSLSYRNEIVLRGTHINNYVEYAVRALKDMVLHHTKAYNIVQLVDFVTTRLDMYYCARLTDFVNNRLSLSRFEKFLPDGKDHSIQIIASRIADMGNGRFQIENSDQDNCEVDMNLGMCTCYVGVRGALCKHQSAVLLNTNEDEWCCLNIHSMADQKQTMFYVASGQETCLDSLSGVGKEENVLQCGSSEAEISQSYSEAEIGQNEAMHDEGNTICEKVGENLRNEVETHSMDEVKRTFQEIIERLEKFEGPGAKRAVENFCKNYSKFCKTDHALSLAMSTFGKYRGLKRRASSKIRVQSTSMSSRKVALKGRQSPASEQN